MVEMKQNVAFSLACFLVVNLTNSTLLRSENGSKKFQKNQIKLTDTSQTTGWYYSRQYAPYENTNDFLSGFDKELVRMQGWATNKCIKIYDIVDPTNVINSYIFTCEPCE